MRVSTKMLGSEVTTRLHGRVVSIEHQPGGRARVTLDVVATQRPTLRYAPDRVRLSARSLWCVYGAFAVGLALGQVLQPPSKRLTGERGPPA